MRNEIITLRSIEKVDLELIRAWNFDPIISKYFSPRLPISLDEQLKWYENQTSSNSKKKLIIELNETKEAIGMLGIMNLDFLNKNCEVGITIGNNNFEGKGIARQAITLVLDFLFKQFDMHMVYLNVLESNSRAIRFFEKMGFNKKGKIEDIMYLDNKYQSYIWMNLYKKDYFCNEDSNTPT